jgi:hypothetical protein
VPFLNVHLEQVIAAYRSTGPRDHAAALHERYTDWRAVDRVIRDSARKMSEGWTNTSR